MRELAALYAQSPVSAETGIAHTRWATHGIPSERNAHPHTSRERVSVVHNGIIENHEALRHELIAGGYDFDSETDTEVIAHLIDHQLETGFPAGCSRSRHLAAGGRLCHRRGRPIAPHEVVGARRGSPMVVGVGEGAQYLASDVYALLAETRRFIYLDDGDLVHLTPDTIQIFDECGAPVRARHQGSAIPPGRR